MKSPKRNRRELGKNGNSYLISIRDLAGERSIISEWMIRREFDRCSDGYNVSRMQQVLIKNGETRLALRLSVE